MKPYVAAYLCLMLVASLFFAPTPNVCAEQIGDCVAIEFYTLKDVASLRLQRITDQAIDAGWIVRRVDTKSEPHIAMQWHIRQVPTIVLLRNGREVDRVLGETTLEDLTQRMLKASSADSLREAPAIAKTNPVKTPAPMIRGQSQPAMVPIGKSSSAVLPSAQSNMAAGDFDLASSTTSQRRPSDPQRATVRIRVDEPNHEAIGTGTIIDSHNGEALVLTCGHLFRDTQGKSKITIEMFEGGQPRAYPATVVDYQIDAMDIGLVAFRPNAAVPIAKLVQRNERLRENETVFSWGCDHGKDPSRRDSHISKLNRYLGESNVEVSGAPVQGRSGGGLFNSVGQLIGVCYAADGELNEGLYSGPEVVYKQLSRLGLQHLYDDVPDALAAPNQIATQPQPNRAPTNALASNTDRNGFANEMMVPTEMTVILKDRDGNQQQIRVDQPSDRLLQALRETTRR